MKYGHTSFSLAILEYCSASLLNDREQYLIDLLQPKYNILRTVKSSKGYTHTQESLLKMKGPRPSFSPSFLSTHRAAIASAARKENHVYDKAFSDLMYKRTGTTVYVYDINNNLISTYSSIIRLKKAYGISMHHKTLYKRINEDMLFNNHKFSFVPLFNNKNKK
jgi:group I intron endonuclease